MTISGSQHGCNIEKTLYTFKDDYSEPDFKNIYTNEDIPEQSLSLYSDIQNILQTTYESIIVDRIFLPKDLDKTEWNENTPIFVLARDKVNNLEFLYLYCYLKKGLKEEENNL